MKHNEINGFSRLQRSTIAHVFSLAKLKR